MLATLTALLLAATPPPERGALVFMQVESPTDKEATALLEESLRHAFASRMAVITCKEAIQDETALKKVLEERGIKSSTDAPKKVSLLADFSRFSCEIPSEGPLWAAWLTAYQDSRSRRREVSLRMRNLRDKESTPTFASLAEPEDHHLSWSELVERCVRRYFEEEETTEIRIVPASRVRVRDPLAVVAHLSFSGPQEAEDLGLLWGLYRCTERSACDHFRTAVDEYVACRQSNRTRSTSDPSLTPVCTDPREGYDRVSVTRVENAAWLHWERRDDSGATTTVTVDIPGEFVILATARGDIAGAQRLTVEPPFYSASFFGGLAYKPLDAFAMGGFSRVLTQSQVGLIGVGVQWGVRLGASNDPPPPFGVRGLVTPSLVLRHHIRAELAVEWWLAPVGLLYEFDPEVGYNLHPGTMLGLTAIWHPLPTPNFNVRLGMMGVARSTSFQTAELYGPLVGASLEF
jgi:hypothetical protein